MYALGVQPPEVSRKNEDEEDFIPEGDDEEFAPEFSGEENAFVDAPHGLRNGEPISADPILPESSLLSFKAAASKLMTAAAWVGMAIGVVSSTASLLDRSIAQNFMKTSDGAFADEVRDLAARRAFTLANAKTCMHKLTSATGDATDITSGVARVNGLECSKDVPNPDTPFNGTQHAGDWTFSAAGNRFTLTFPFAPQGQGVALGISDTTYFEVNKNGEIGNVKQGGADSVVIIGDYHVKEGPRLASFAKQVYGALQK
jgi:hypothetical protein